MWPLLYILYHSLNWVLPRHLSLQQTLREIRWSDLSVVISFKKSDKFINALSINTRHARARLHTPIGNAPFFFPSSEWGLDNYGDFSTWKYWNNQSIPQKYESRFWDLRFSFNLIDPDFTWYYIENGVDVTFMWDISLLLLKTRATPFIFSFTVIIWMKTCNEIMLN